LKLHRLKPVVSAYVVNLSTRQKLKLHRLKPVVFPRGVRMIRWRTGFLKFKGAAIPKLKHGVNEKDEF
jgi:hypothetical protein